MAKKDPKLVAKNLLDVIGSANVEQVTNCQTRLRLNLSPTADVDIAKLRQVETVLGVITPSANELQIVLGPGWVSKVREEFEAMWNQTKIGAIATVDENGHAQAQVTGQDTFKSAKDVAFEIKSKMRKKQNVVQSFFSKFSRIFAPMIIGFIGAGILSGIASIMQSVDSHVVYNAGVKTIVFNSVTAQSWYNFLSIALNIWKDGFIIVVGWRTAEVFGGSGVLGAIAAAIYVPSFSHYVVSAFINDATAHNYNFLGIHVPHNIYNWLIVGFRPDDTKGYALQSASGNILGALLAGAVSLWVEKGVKKFVPNVVDTIVTPTIVIFIMMFVNFLLLVPVSGYLYTAVAWFFQHLYNNPFGAFVLSAIFLVAVAFGIHQGFIPVYQVLLNNTGVNGLFPILGVAGFSQIGAALCLYMLAEKSSPLRRQISGSIIPGLFGIGEPLIYGVTLPRIRPFITACIGAGFGGFFIGAMSMWGGYEIGLNTMFGPSGLPAAILMTTPDHNIAMAVIIYLIGLVISAGFGFAVTWFGYSPIIMYGAKAMNKIYDKKTANFSVQRCCWYTLCFATVVGILGYWLYAYFDLSKEERAQLKGKKVE